MEAYLGERHPADTPSQQPQPDPTKLEPNTALNRANAAMPTPQRRYRRPVPHSQQHPLSPQPWPPPGWGRAGLIEHLDRSDRACALIKALADPTWARRRLSEDEARAIELHQLGTDAAAKLREAADAVLAIQQMAEADTAEIDMRPLPTQREATA